MKPVTPDVSIRKLREPFSTHVLVKVIVLVCIVGLISLAIIVPIRLIPPALATIQLRVSSLLGHEQAQTLVTTPLPAQGEVITVPSKKLIGKDIVLTTTDKGYKLESTSSNISARTINITHNGNPAGTIIIINNH